MSSARFSSNILLQDADVLLKEAGFSTSLSFLSASDLPCLLAEDRFFVVAVVAAETLDDARHGEPFAVSGLLDRLTAAEAGAKRWDAYVVLLAAEPIETAEQTRDVVDLQYNTRGVRRIVATGVNDRESLAVALRPFLPLPPRTVGGLGNALDELVDQLVLNGVPAEAAPRYVAAFAQQGTLDDV
jgi:hypothetical protein